MHSPRRGPHTRVAADAVGYVLRAGGVAVYFPGDTDLFPEMATWAPIDVALLPIWGWGPTLGEGHLDPGRAVQATELIGPGLVVPIHWGTFSPLGRAPGTPELGRRTGPPLPRRAPSAPGPSDRLRVLAPGGHSCSAPITACPGHA